MKTAQTNKQRKNLIMLDQHRRHEVNITPDCFKDFGVDDDYQLSPAHGFFLGVMIGLVGILSVAAVVLW